MMMIEEEGEEEEEEEGKKEGKKFLPVEFFFFFFFFPSLSCERSWSFYSLFFCFFYWFSCISFLLKLLVLLAPDALGDARQLALLLLLLLAALWAVLLTLHLAIQLILLDLQRGFLEVIFLCDRLTSCFESENKKKEKEESNIRSVKRIGGRDSRLPPSSSAPLPCPPSAS